MKDLIKKLKKSIKEQRVLVNSFEDNNGNIIKDELDRIIKDSEYIFINRFNEILRRYYEIIITNKTTKIIEFNSRVSLHPSGIHYRGMRLEFEQIVCSKYPPNLKSMILDGISEFFPELEMEMNNLFEIIDFIKGYELITDFVYVFENPIIMEMPDGKYRIDKIHTSTSLYNDGYPTNVIDYSYSNVYIVNILLEEFREEIISGFKNRLEKRILLQKKVLGMFDKYFGKEIVIANLEIKN